MIKRLYYIFRFQWFGLLPRGTFRLSLLGVLAILVLTWGVGVVKGSQSRMSYYYEHSTAAVYWGWRLLFNSGEDEIVTPEFRSPGTLDGFTRDEKVLVRVYDEGQIYQITTYLADLDITDKVLTATVINNHRRESVTVDYYELPDKAGEYAAVIWLKDGRPLNEILIDRGAARAMSSPPTNIVNNLMYQYHKRMMVEPSSH